MKQRDLKHCVLCSKGVMHDGAPAFLRVRVEYMGIDLNAVRRQHGLELAHGGMIAAALGPDEDLALRIGEPRDVLVCQTCARQPGTPLFALLLLESED